MIGRLVIPRRRFMSINRHNRHRFLEKCYIFQQSMLHKLADFNTNCPIMSCRCDMPMAEVVEFVGFSEQRIPGVTEQPTNVAHLTR